MGAWLISNPMGWIILLGGTIAATVGLVDLFTTSVEEHREKLESLKSEYSDVKSELDGLKGELDGTQSRINELESKGKLTFTEAEELNNLRKQNNELQRSIDLLELQNKTKKKELNNQFIETMNSDIEQELYTRNENDEVVQYMPMSGQTVTDDNEADYINQRFKDLQRLRDELASASTEAEKERINRQIKGIEDYFIQKNKDFTETAEGIDYIQNPTNEDDRKVNEWLDYINDFQDKMAVAMGGDNAKENAFNRLVDNWKFDEALNPLQKLGKEGKVTLDELKKRMDNPVFVEFVNKLKDIGFISDTTDGSLRFLASAFNGTTTSAKAYLDTLDDNESISNFINNLDDEAKALGTTKDELSKLTAGHIILNNTKLSLEDKISQIKNLGIMAGWSQQKIADVIELMNRASGNLPNSMTQHEKDMRSGSAQTALYNMFGNWKQVDTNVNPKRPTPPGDDKDKDTSKEDNPSYNDPTDAVIDRINSNARLLASNEELAESARDRIDEENDYAGAIKVTNDLLDIRKKRLGELYKANSGFQNEIDYLQNTNPYDEASWFDGEGNATEAYYKDLNSASTGTEQKKISSLFDSLSKYHKAIADNKKEIKSLNDEIFNDEQKLKQLYSDQYDDKIADDKHQIEILESAETPDNKAIIDYYENIKTTAHDKAEFWRSLGYDENSTQVQDAQNEWLSADSAIKEINDKEKEKYKTELDDIINHGMDYISERNKKNDWVEYGDTALDAINRLKTKTHQFYKDGKISKEDYLSQMKKLDDQYYDESLTDLDKQVQKERDYISDREMFGDWGEYSDSLEESLKRIGDIYTNAYNNDLLSTEEYNDKMKGIQKEIRESRKSELDKTLNDLDEFIADRNKLLDWDSHGKNELDVINEKRRTAQLGWANRDISREEYDNYMRDFNMQEYDYHRNDFDENVVNKAQEFIDERNTKNDWSDYDHTESDIYKWLQEEAKRWLESGKFSNAVYEEYVKSFALDEYKSKVSELDKTIDDIENIRKARSVYSGFSEWFPSELRLIRQEIDAVTAALKNQTISYDEYKKRMEELSQDAYSTGLSELTSAINSELEEYENRINKVKEGLSLKSAKKQSKQTLLQSYFGVINSITDAQHEIDKELASSKTMKEYLNKDTQKLLFNQDDYDSLSETLSHIQDEAMTLQDKYNKDILSATAENLDQITSKYQMQYETLMKTYEIAKAELEVAKKRQQLDNVLNERNVRMFINGSWQWVANTQDVINAQNELSEAEHAKTTAETSKSQTLDINKLQTAQDEIATEINLLDKDMEDYRKKWDRIQKTLEGGSRSVAEVLADIAMSDSPMLQNIIKTSGKAIAGFVKDLTGNELDIPDGYISSWDYMDKIKNASNAAEVFELNNQRNAKIKAEGRSEDQLTDLEAWEIWKAAKNGYASGTGDASAGFHYVGEKGFEAYIDNNGNLVPILQQSLIRMYGGEKVFNAEQLSNVGKLWDLSNFIGRFRFDKFSIKNPAQTYDNSNSNNVIINGLTVDTGSRDGQELANALRRFVGNH